MKVLNCNFATEQLTQRLMKTGIHFVCPKSILAIISILVTNIVSAADYKPMIRYDRVWENFSYNYEGDLVKCVKFDGTEEIGGKTYHKLIAFKNTVRKYDSTLGRYVFSTPEDVYKPEGYMREEDGIVYTLVRENDKYSIGALYTCPDDLEEGDIITEKVIYNFNVSAGDVFNMYSFIMRNGLPNQFKVFSTELVDIAGEECKKIDFGPGFSGIDGDMHFYNQYSMIEGIGASYYGCLNYTEFIGQPTKIWYYNYIIRVFDMAGNVIYSSGDICDGLDYGSFCSVDKIAEKSSLTISADCISFGEAGVDNTVCSKCKDKKHRYQPDIIRRYQKAINFLVLAGRIEDLWQNKSLNYEVLSGDKVGRSSIRVNDKYRIEFVVTSNENEPILTICNIIELSNHYN